MTPEQAVDIQKTRRQLIKLLCRLKVELTGEHGGFFLQEWLEELFPDKEWVCPVCILGASIDKKEK